MPGKINRVPLGLLDLLQSKTDGMNPGLLADSVAGVIDIEEFYLGQRLSHEFFTFATSAVGVSGSLQVTDGETWVLWGISLNWVALGAGSIKSVHVQLEAFPDAPSSLSAVIIADYPEMTSLNLNDIITRATILERPIHLPSGMIVRGITGQRNTTENVAVNIGIYRLRT